MHDMATEMSLSDSERYGDLIWDEMSIQVCVHENGFFCILCLFLHLSLSSTWILCTITMPNHFPIAFKLSSAAWLANQQPWGPAATCGLYGNRPITLFCRSGWYTKTGITGTTVCICRYLWNLDSQCVTFLPHRPLLWSYMRKFGRLLTNYINGVLM